MTVLKKMITATILFTIASITNSFAQEAPAIDTLQPSYEHNDLNEKEKNSHLDVAVNPVVTSKFSTLFPDATSEVWTAGTDNFRVSFLNNNRKANASFTLKGKLNYLITVCALEHLPEAFSKKITNDYATYHLFDAIEITAHNTVAYQAVLTDSKGYITLRYTSEGIEEIQRLNNK
jgi:hypothetical protein